MKRIFLILLGLMSLLSTQPLHAQDDPAAWLQAQINALRGSQGLDGYSINPTLTALAQAHSAYMASVGTVTHDDAAGNGPTERARAAGYMAGIYVGENIYIGGTAADAWNWWMNSSTHYSAIVDPRFKEVGIGVVESGGGRYYTLNFGMGGEGIPAPEPPPEEEPAEEESETGDHLGAEWGAPPVAAEAPQEAVDAAPVQEEAAPPVVQQQRIVSTPTSSLPSQTPTSTWTPTATWTPSPTTTAPPPTGTPIVLPTAAALSELALLSSPSPSPTLIEVAQLSPVDEIGIISLPPTQAASTPNEKDGGWRQFLPLIIAGQVVGLSAIFRRLWRSRA